MTPEIETTSRAAGSNDGEVSDKKITRASETSKSTSNNGGKGCGQGGCTGRGS